MLEALRHKPLPAAGPRAGRRTEVQIALQCLAHLPTGVADDYGHWIEAGMALHSVDPGADMLAAWDAWSSHSAKHVPGECNEKWRGFSSMGGVTIGSLINLARRYGFDVYGQNGRTAMGRQLSQSAGSKTVLQEEAGKSCESALKSLSEPPTCGPVLNQLVLDPKNPLDTARKFRAQLYAHRDDPTLHFAQDVYWRWNGSAYHAVEMAALRKQLYEYADRAEKLVKTGNNERFEPFKPTRSSIDNIQDALRAVSHTEAIAPSWLSDEPGLPHPSQIIAARNGLLHLQRSGPISPRKPTPLFFSTNAIDFDFDPHAPEPRQWLKFLDLLWPDDQEAVCLLAEWMGYVLTADTRRSCWSARRAPARAPSRAYSPP